MRVERTRADDPLGLCQGHPFDLGRAFGKVHRREEAEIPLLPDEVDAAAHDAIVHGEPCAVARGRDGVPRLARDAEPLDLCRDLAPRTRRVRQQHDAATARAEPLQRGDGVREGGDAVVDAAPQVAEQRVVIGRDVGEAVDDAGHAGGSCARGLTPVWTLAARM